MKGIVEILGLRMSEVKGNIYEWRERRDGRDEGRKIKMLDSKDANHV